MVVKREEAFVSHVNIRPDLDGGPSSLPSLPTSNFVYWNIGKSRWKAVHAQNPGGRAAVELDRMFERSLSSLIKGLRSHRGRDEPKYVATLMEEIKHEIRSGDMDVKAEAVLKLTYVSYIALVAYSKYH